MAIITVKELTDYLGQLTLTSIQEGITDTVILPGVQQALENYLNRPVEPIVVRESLRADDSGFLWFRVTPIHQILSVVRSDGPTVPVTSTPPAAIDPGELRLLDEWGDPELFGYQLDTPFGGGYYGYPSLVRPPHYTVQYIAGYNGYVNEGLKLAMCRVAAREVEMQFDDTMSIRGGATEAAQDSDNRVKGWTDAELQEWDRLRRRVVV